MSRCAMTLRGQRTDRMRNTPHSGGKDRQHWRWGAGVITGCCSLIVPPLIGAHNTINGQEGYAQELSSTTYQHYSSSSALFASKSQAGSN